MRGLAGKTCLVTGAGRGIGRAIAERLYSEGVSVVLVDRSGEGVVQAKAELEATIKPAAAAKLLALGCDVTDPEAIAALFERAKAELGPIKLLVNNVGGGRQRVKAVDLTANDLIDAYASNVVSMALVTAAYAKQLPERGGSVVNLSSSAAVRPKAGRPQYTGAKAAVSSITQSLAIELAQRQIRVNAVCPGPVMTEEILARFDDPEQRPREEARLAKIPLGRLAEPAEIADVVAFLLSDEARYLTGVLLPVDGGYTVAT